MRGMLPADADVGVEEKPFRHSKHRDFFNELAALNDKHNLGVKDKIEDLKKYIKSREDKTEQAEAKNKKLTEELEKNKKVHIKLDIIPSNLKDSSMKSK